ncbi:CIA30 family protein [Shewanella olleyana]|uniref:CIA30 family protein n=1 Tax=Shewanella olleyana TaxID=135626 RepID=UPI00200D0967|nr:CIA30 family protein [Shewanella olleyana]MCL1066014.1 CIA30 family protein [Shewanella olleyana]
MTNILIFIKQLCRRYTSAEIGVLLKGLFLSTSLLATILFQTSVSAMEIQFSSQQQLSSAKISNDTVMGGISSSEIENDAAQDQPIFSGNVSLANNGGFASMEYRINTPIPASNSVKLTVMGDGKRYQLRFKTPKLSFGEAYVASFTTIAGQQTQHIFTPNDFKPQFRGRSVNAPDLSFADIDRVGLLIADKQAGEFSLMLDSMTFID